MASTNGRNETAGLYAAARAVVATVVVATAWIPFASCTTEGPAPPPSIDVSVLSLSVSAVDIDSARVVAIVRVANAGPAGVVLSSLGLKAYSEGVTLATPSIRDMGSTRLEPGEESRAAFEFDVDAPAGDAPTIPLRLEARLEYSSAPGGNDSMTIERACEFPRIMPPTLRIASIRILKDELINTKLGVDLVIENPNAFPLAFSALDYRLYGEGRYWASGSLAKAFVAPARQTATASLYLTMNFTDMDRSLLDQVIKLAAVRYRLVGAGRIDTGLEFLPQFVQPFDMAGETGVIR
ncbi:MAG: hypothetical protein CVV47_17105 [Spirochaetae bacterium HGW-Spirochaetae-3]|jgi:LEA14-like dessication related protein|nr:MAG: hypothetical protein CVV47_17105 [Spirochaetae bacterium HGW-Spirochaetae-3]